MKRVLFVSIGVILLSLLLVSGQPAGGPRGGGGATPSRPTASSPAARQPATGGARAGGSSTSAPRSAGSRHHDDSNNNNDNHDEVDLREARLSVDSVSVSCSDGAAIMCVARLERFDENEDHNDNVNHHGSKSGDDHNDNRGVAGVEVRLSSTLDTETTCTATTDNRGIATCACIPASSNGRVIGNGVITAKTDDLKAIGFISILAQKQLAFTGPGVAFAGASTTVPFVLQCTASPGQAGITINFAFNGITQSATTDATGTASSTFNVDQLSPGPFPATCTIPASAQNSNCGPVTARRTITVVSLTTLEFLDINCCGEPSFTIQLTQANGDGVPHQLVVIDAGEVGTCTTGLTNEDGIASCTIEGGTCPLPEATNVVALFFGSFNSEFLCSSVEGELESCTCTSNEQCAELNGNTPCCEIPTGSTTGTCVASDTEGSLQCPAGSLCQTTASCEDVCCVNNVCATGTEQGDCPNGAQCDPADNGPEVCASDCCDADKGQCVAPAGYPGVPGVCPQGSGCNGPEDCASDCCDIVHFTPGQCVDQEMEVAGIVNPYFARCPAGSVCLNDNAFCFSGCCDITDTPNVCVEQVDDTYTCPDGSLCNDWLPDCEGCCHPIETLLFPGTQGICEMADTNGNCPIGDFCEESADCASDCCSEDGFCVDHPVVGLVSDTCRS